MGADRHAAPSRRDILHLGLAGALGPAMPAWAQGAATRVALVVGNAAYAGAPRLNPAHDALAMSTVLSGLGFRVVELRDGTKAQIDDAIAQTRELLSGRNGVGLLYYAGHGLQLDWHNYLLPVDAAPASAADVPRLSVDTQDVIDAFKAAGNRMNILVLDACRDNPFGASGSAKGLAPMDAPPGTYMAYATAPGNLAEDGSDGDRNGLYARFLVKEMQRPEAGIEDVFKRVRLQVRQASKGRQVPWDSSSLEEDFVFASGRKIEVPTRREREAAFDAEKADWDRIKDSRKAEDFFAFLQKYPSGTLAEQTQFRLDQLAAAAVKPALSRRELPALPSGVRRYVVGDFYRYEQIDHLAGTSQRIGWRVTAADDRLVEINGGQVVLDQMGGWIKDKFGVKDPPMVLIPAELFVGKRWRTAWWETPPEGARVRSFRDLKVAGIETVEVPAGRFATYRVEASGEAIGPWHITRGHATYWIDPATMQIVRAEDSWFDRSGREFYRTTRQLVTSTRAPRS